MTLNDGHAENITTPIDREQPVPEDTSPSDRLDADERQQRLAANWRDAGGDHVGCYFRQCSVCDRPFYARRPDARYCCYRCGLSRQRVRQEQRRRRRARRKPCDRCGEWFTGSRADVRYCSAACRQAAYRKRADVTGARCGKTHSEV